jgi:transcriptional regulator with XRE-family HTH domain
MFNATRLKKLRKDLGFSQEEMCLRLNIQQSSYSKYETNKAELNLSLLQKIKEEFNVDPNEFIIIDNKNKYSEKDTFDRVDKRLQAQNHYSFPKEIVDSILLNQQNIIQLINLVIKKEQ